MLAQDTSVSGEGSLKVDHDTGGQTFGVYGAIDNWAGGTDSDADGYYETFDFDVGIDGDADPAATEVYGKMVCNTTGQAWWSAASWTVQGYGIDYHWFAFDETDFAGHITGNTTLDFTVEIWDASKTSMLAQDTSVSGESDLLVDASGGSDWFAVYGTVDSWTPGTDADSDGFYETYSFRIGADGDAIPGPSEVTAKVVCQTTSQSWWIPGTWIVEGAPVDYHYIEFTESSFAGHLVGATDLDFSVELWNAAKTELLANTEGVNGEDQILVEPSGDLDPQIRLDPNSVEFVNEAATALSVLPQAPASATGQESASVHTIHATGAGADWERTYFFDATTLTTQEAPAGTALSLKNCVLPDDPVGRPWLPARFVTILLPSGADVIDVEGAADERLLLRGVDVMPVQPAQPKSLPKQPAAQKNAAVYSSGDLYPEAYVSFLGQQVVRGHTVAQLRLNPVRYRPAAKELYFCDQIRVKIEYRVPGRRAASAVNAQVFRRFLTQLVDNPGEISAFRPLTLPATKTTVDYLVITTPGLQSAFQTLATHRQNANGLQTAVVTTSTISSSYSGSDLQERIRSCIADYVDNHGTAFVVLGGDDTVIPDRDCYVTANGYTEDEMPTDLYYSGLDGDWDLDDDGRFGESSTAQGDESDMGPDVFVGRIPVRSSSQAQSYIQKLVALETAPPSGLAGSFFFGGTECWDTYSGNDRPSDTVSDGHAAFRASNHPQVTDSEMWCRRLYRDGVTPFLSTTRLGYLYDSLTSWDSSTCGDYEQSPSHMRTKLNQGWENMFFCGHGNITLWGLEVSGFYSSDAAQLSGLTPVVYTDACLTGGFDDNTDPCLSEAFIRNSGGGAVAYMGCSRYGWGSPDSPPASSSSDGGPSTDYGYEFYDLWLNRTSETIGEVFAAHKAHFAGMSSSGNSYRWIQFGLNLQGDPAYGLAAAGGPNQALITVHNDGTGVLTVSGISESVDWLSTPTTCPFDVPAGGSASAILEVDWVAAPKGTSHTQVEFISNDADGSAYVSVTAINGDEEDPDLVVLHGTTPLPNGANLDLGTVASGASADYTMTLRNDGDAALSISSLAVQGADADKFSLGTYPGSIAAGASTSVDLQFNAPSTPSGSAVADLVVESDDPDDNPYTIHLAVAWDSGASISHASIGYSSPGTATINCEVDYPKDRSLLSLTCTPALPSGWTLASASGDGAPEVSGSDIVFVGGLGNNPMVFSYVVNVPSDVTGIQTLRTSVSYWLSGSPDPSSTYALPDPLSLSATVSYHDADYAEPYWAISAPEISRVLAYWRAGTYHCYPTSTDGYAPGSGDTSGPRHVADYREPYWSIDGTEVNRVLAYWRAGGYHVDGSTPDGYAPGAATGGPMPAGPKPISTVTQDVAEICAAGAEITVAGEVDYTGDMLSLLVRPALPEGWTVTAAEVNKGSCEIVGGEIVLTGQIPVSPLEMTYKVATPDGCCGMNGVVSEVEYMMTGMPVAETIYASPNPANVRVVGSGEIVQASVNAPGSHFVVQWASVQDRDYAMQYRHNLLEGSWLPLEAGISGTGMLISRDIDLSLFPGETTLFVRVIEE